MLEHFMFKEYHERDYNCAHFVAEVWEHITGNDITEDLQGFLLPVGERKIYRDKLRNFKRLDRPKSPSIAVFRGGLSEPHAGIYIDGKIFHIKKAGVFYQNVGLAKAYHYKVNYYEHRGNNG